MLNVNSQKKKKKTAKIRNACTGSFVMIFRLFILLAVINYIIYMHHKIFMKSKCFIPITKISFRDKCTLFYITEKA